MYYARRAAHAHVVIRGEGRPGAKDVKNANWVEKRKVKNELAVKCHLCSASCQLRH